MRIVLICILFYSLFGQDAAPKKEPLSQASREWLDEIVYYIITKAEKEYFINLPTEADRGQFIEQFWRVRDPDPTTEINEFKMQYYKRIALANRFFSNEGRPGWKTERGRIYIMLGPPMEINRDVNCASRQNLQARAFHGSCEIWNYFGLKNPKLPYNIEFRFIDRLGTGQYVLENSLDISQGQPFELSTAHAYFNHMEYVTETAKLHLIDSASPKGVVTTMVTYDALPLSHQILFFKGNESVTFVPLVINIPLARLKGRTIDTHKYYSLVLSIQVRDNNNQLILDKNKEINFKRSMLESPSKGEKWKVRTAVSLKPGLVQLELGLFDRFQGKVGQISKKFRVPSYNSDLLQISDIVIGERSETEHPSSIDPRIPEGMVVQRHVTRNRQLTILFEIYHLQADPVTKRSRYKVFFYFSKGGKLLNTVTLPERVIPRSDCRVNTSIKLTRFPIGPCSLVVEVRDLNSQQQIKKNINLFIGP